MNTIVKFLAIIILYISLLSSCDSHSEKEGHKHDKLDTQTVQQEEHRQENLHEIHLSHTAYLNLKVKAGTIQQRDMGEYIDVNGYLTLPPQAEANVTAMLGSNVFSIKVMQGDRVKKGQVLAYLTHPDFIVMQSEYMEASGDLEYMEKEYIRQKNLYEKQVIADYLALEAIEVVHNLRDAALLRNFGSTSWELVFQGSDDIVSGDQGCYGGINTCNFYFKNINSQPILDTCDTCDVFLDKDNFYYFQTLHDGFASNGSLSGFKRKIRIIPGSDDGQVIVLVNVSWDSGEVSYAENLYLWQ
jgi:biotin carboxyl carrier protein